MSLDREDIDPAIESVADKTHRLVSATLGSLPIGSGAAVEMFNVLITPPLEKRRKKWMLDVTEAIQRLELGKVVDVEALFQNEEFITLFISATQHAIKNHSKEKLDSFRNIVINKACGMNLGDSLEDIFLNIIGQFTPLHISMLKIFHEGFVWNMRNNKNVKDDDIPDMLIANIGSYREYLDVDRVLIKICLRDLMLNELIQHWIIKKVNKNLENGEFYCDPEQWGGRSTSNMFVKHGVAIKVDRKPGSYVTRTTHMGNKLVEFISAPTLLNG